MTVANHLNLRITIPESSTQTKSRLCADHYIHEIIGMGSTSVVRRGVRKHDGHIVALKIIQTQSDEEKERCACNEFEILSKADHPNILKVYDFYQEKDFACIVMEYLRADSESFFLNDSNKLSCMLRNQPDSYLVIHVITCQLLSTVEYLHGLGIIHRDIAPQNIFTNLQNLSVKLIDFNCATVETACMSPTGTPAFAAPEMRDVDLIKGYGSKVDIWSLGKVCEYLMENLRDPHAHSTNNDRLHRFVCACLKPLPDDRPTSLELKNILLSE